MGMAVLEIRIELKKGVADPEGKNTKKTLESLGFKGLGEVKTVKLFEMDSNRVLSHREMHRLSSQVGTRDMKESGMRHLSKSCLFYENA